MQDELRQLQEAEVTQYADGKKTETRRHSKRTPLVTAGHTLKRTWSTEKDPSGERKPKYAFVANNSSAVDRWLEESMREQPWHDIGVISELPPSKKAFVMRGKTGSNSAVDGSEQQNSSKSDK